MTEHGINSDTALDDNPQLVILEMDIIWLLVENYSGSILRHPVK